LAENVLLYPAYTNIVYAFTLISAQLLRVNKIWYMFFTLYLTAPLPLNAANFQYNHVFIDFLCILAHCFVFCRIIYVIFQKHSKHIRNNHSVRGRFRYLFSNFIILTQLLRFMILWLAIYYVVVHKLGPWRKGHIAGFGRLVVRPFYIRYAVLYTILFAVFGKQVAIHMPEYIIHYYHPLHEHDT